MNHGALFYVFRLAALHTPAQQQHHTLAAQAVIHPIPWTQINTQLPNSLSAIAVITETSLFQSTYPTNDGHLYPPVAQIGQPIQKQITGAIFRHVMLNTIHGNFRL